MVKRFVFVHGPWQLIMATSALRQAAESGQRRTIDTLVIYSLPDGPLSDSLLEVTRRIAAVVWPWQGVVVLNDVIDWWSLRDVPGCTSLLRDKLGAAEPDELWVVDVPNNPTKITAEAYPRARIVLFEDGLMSYLPFEDHRLSVSQCLGQPRLALRALKFRLRERLVPGDLSMSSMLSRHQRNQRELSLDELGVTSVGLPQTAPVDSAQDPFRTGDDWARFVNRG